LNQKMRGRPSELYEYIRGIPDAIQSGRINAAAVLRETTRIFIIESLFWHSPKAA